jgi:hypothetical protein
MRSGCGISAHSLCSSCFTAGGAPLWLIGIALRLEKFLFFCGEREIRAALNTPELLVFERHQMTSSLLYWLELVIRQPIKL